MTKQTISNNLYHILKNIGNEDLARQYFIYRTGSWSCFLNKEAQSELLNMTIKRHYTTMLQIALELKVGIAEGTVISKGDKKYYVHFIEDDDYSYLNSSPVSNRYITSRKVEKNGYKTQFTKDEVKAINPKYLEFLEEVE